MSDGPRGQSKLTTGRPHRIASTITIPKPSKRELSTNTDASRNASPRCRVGPTGTRRAVQPVLGDQPLQRGALRPAAVDLQRPARVPRATCANARISRSNPFCARQPAGRDHHGVSSGDGPPPAPRPGSGICTTRVRSEQRARSRPRRRRSARQARRAGRSGAGCPAVSAGRCAWKRMCSCATLVASRGAAAATSSAHAGRVPTTISPPARRRRRSSFRLGPQAGGGIRVVLGVDEQAGECGQRALDRPAIGLAAVVERRDGDTGREREERSPPPAALDRDDLDVARPGEMAREREDRRARCRPSRTRS